MPPKTGHIPIIKEPVEVIDKRNIKFKFLEKWSVVCFEDLELRLRELKNKDLRHYVEFLKLGTSLFPKEVLDLTPEPFQDWSDDELRTFVNNGVAPKNKIVPIN